MKGEAAPTKTILGVTGIAVATILGAWCVPALASSGVAIECDETEGALITTEISATAPKLVKLPELTSAVAESASDDAEESEAAEEPANRSNETPAITTRLPGLSESSVPSFRRKMLRTDI